MSIIAAIVYGPDEDCDGLLTAAARAWREEGQAVVGLVQINGGASCDDLDMELEVVDTGRRISICQDLGTGSANACRLDSTGLADAAGALRAALKGPVSLVVVNKFGRMEMDGAGLIDEIGAVVAAGLPLVIGVPQRFREAWDAFAGGLDDKVACNRAAVEAWRRQALQPLAAE